MTTNKIDFSFTALRRINMAAERQEQIYVALHIALIVVFCGVLYALYTVRADVLEAIERSRT